MFCCHHDRAKGYGNLPIIEYKSLFCSLLNPTTGRSHKIWSTSKAKNLATRCWMITEKMLMHCVSNLFILIDDNTALCKLKGSYSWWQTMKNQNQKLRKWRSEVAAVVILIKTSSLYDFQMLTFKRHSENIIWNLENLMVWKSNFYTHGQGPSIRTFYSLCSEQTED